MYSTCDFYFCFSVVFCLHALMYSTYNTIMFFFLAFLSSFLFLLMVRCLPCPPSDHMVLFPALFTSHPPSLSRLRDNVLFSTKWGVWFRWWLAVGFLPWEGLAWVICGSCLFIVFMPLCIFGVLWAPGGGCFQQVSPLHVNV